MQCTHETMVFSTYTGEGTKKRCQKTATTRIRLLTKATGIQLRTFVVCDAHIEPDRPMRDYADYERVASLLPVKV